MINFAAFREALTTIAMYGTVGALLAGCAVQTGPATPAIEVPGAFSDSGRHVAPERWWITFDDPQLDRLVESALQSNFDLESAWHRLREARAIVDRSSASLQPRLDAQALGETVHADPENDDRLLLGLAAEYEIDLWGRLRSGIDAERFRARATRDDYRTVALTLSAEVARAWFRLSAATEQRNLLLAQLDANTKILDLVRARFGGGVVRSVDILRQSQLVEETREQLIQEEAGIRVLRHQLAELLGLPPAAGRDLAVGPLPGLPPLPDTGIPLELVRRRPDLRRAYHLLQAADRELASAVSNRYPRLTLSASAATTETDSSDLFDDWLTSLGVNLLAPVFDGGERKAEVDRSQARRDQHLAEYAQATLIAFWEVEDALVRETKQLERIESLRAQVRLAGRSYEQLRIEYFNGLGNYIDVLTALTDEQRLRRDLLTARRDLLEFRIALYRALAGGFDTDRDADTVDGINRPARTNRTVRPRNNGGHKSFARTGD